MAPAQQLVINEAIDRIKNETLAGYVYDLEIATPIRRWQTLQASNERRKQPVRRRDTYPGSGSILRQGNDGLEWASLDPAESKKALKPSKRWDNKVPTNKEIERQSKEDDKAEGKLIRSFISQCATAYASGKLDPFWPAPPKPLKPRIKTLGGNVAWLGSHPQYQSLFHKAYCRILGREIPIEQVWAQRK